MLDGRIRATQVTLEAVKGTALAGATGLWCYDPLIERDDNAFEQEDAASGLGGPAAFVPGPATGKTTLRTWLRSNGVSSLDAGILAVLQACGLKLSGGNLAIAGAFADQKTLTVDVNIGGEPERLYGAAGNWQLTAENGKPVELQFDLQGKHSSLPSAAMPTITPPATGPMKAESMTLTLTDGPTGGLKVAKLTLNANNSVEAREDLTATAGIGYFQIGSNRRYMIGLDPEATGAADWDPHAIHEAGTTGELVIVLTDGTVNMTITAPALQLRPVKKNKRGSKLVYEIMGQCNPDSGDDEITVGLAAAGG